MKSLRRFDYLLTAVICAAVLTACGDNTTHNTTHPSGFSKDAFDKIDNGIARAHVVEMLGTPFEVYSHVDFGTSGGSNNYPGEKTKEDFPAAESIRFALVYSRPRDQKADYVVYEVFIDPATNLVSGKQSYETD